MSLWEIRRAFSEAVLWVPTELLRFQTGVAYTRQQHHGVRYLDDGFDALRQFYDLHTPESALEANFVFEKKEDSNAPSLWCGKPWGAEWDRSKYTAGHQAFGPASEAFLRAEANRYKRIRSSILKLGYRHRHQGEDGIRFQILIDDCSQGNRYKVLPVAGKHRVAVLAHLGWKSIPMSPVGSPDREIRRSDVLNWPGVTAGKFSKSEAEAYFLSYFRDPHATLLPHW